MITASGYSRAPCTYLTSCCHLSIHLCVFFNVQRQEGGFKTPGDAISSPSRTEERARCATITAYLVGGTGIISSVPDCFSETSGGGQGFFWPIKLQGGKSRWRGSREPPQHNPRVACQMLPVQRASILGAPFDVATCESLMLLTKSQELPCTEKNIMVPRWKTWWKTDATHFGTPATACPAGPRTGRRGQLTSYCQCWGQGTHLWGVWAGSTLIYPPRYHQTGANSGVEPQYKMQ